MMIACAASFTPTETTAAALPAWTYDGDADGQENWGTLSHEYAACELGKEQSPIEISYTKSSFKPPLKVRYTPVNATVYFDGRHLRADVKDRAVLSSEAQDYALTSVMFHSPSEHVVKDVFYPVELALVHKSADGKILILSIFLQKGAANPALDAILAQSSEIIDRKKEVRFDAASLLPPQQTYYAYRGSLSYPPCTEGIERRIIKQPITASGDQIKAIGTIVGRNARLTQPVYTRTIEETGL